MGSLNGAIFHLEQALANLNRATDLANGDDVTRAMRTGEEASAISDFNRLVEPCRTLLGGGLGKLTAAWYSRKFAGAASEIASVAAPMEPAPRELSQRQREQRS